MSFNVSSRRHSPKLEKSRACPKRFPACPKSRQKPNALLSNRRCVARYVQRLKSTKVEMPRNAVIAITTQNPPAYTYNDIMCAAN